MFSTSPYAVVPEYLKDEATIVSEIAQWKGDIMKVAFNADSTPIPDPVKGSYLITSVPELERIAENALNRITKCVPPSHIAPFPWSPTGRFHNEMEVMKSNFHSCANESWNSTTPDFVVGDNSTEQLAAALYYEGIVRQNERNMRKRNTSENSGHFDLERTLSVNKWAGHGPEAEQVGLIKLVANAPHRQLLRPKATGETLVKEVGAFDAVKQRRRLVASTGGDDKPVPLLGPLPSAGGLIPASVAQQLGVVSSKQQGKRPIAAVTISSDDEEGVEEVSAPTAQLPTAAPPAPAMALQQAGSGKKLAGRESETKNKWLCTCKDPTVEASEGRIWHDSRCIRGRWARNLTVSFAPTVGDRVQILQPGTGQRVDVGLQGGKYYVFTTKKPPWQAG
uniref:Uncharacterized protein n=1 Tax=Haptolina brevifila TaxID=156173 RepID=A0A7S2NAF1_9EUKA|mmetsp:Transcript_71642/g.142065  ORF Transcript_71642/g.142065 Transcript_71642/m.142065 type:complete len:393 (+) Transcript_71642:350-1528(+)